MTIAQIKIYSVALAAKTMYNMSSSAVDVPRSTIVELIDSTGVRGYGERQPKASNATAAGMAQNRRVEIMCIR